MQESLPPTSTVRRFHCVSQIRCALPGYEGAGAKWFREHFPQSLALSFHKSFPRGYPGLPSCRFSGTSGPSAVPARPVAPCERIQGASLIVSTTTKAVAPSNKVEAYNAAAAHRIQSRMRLTAEKAFLERRVDELKIEQRVQIAVQLGLEADDFVLHTKALRFGSQKRIRPPFR